MVGIGSIDRLALGKYTEIICGGRTVVNGSKLLDNY